MITLPRASQQSGWLNQVITVNRMQRLRIRLTLGM